MSPIETDEECPVRVVWIDPPPPEDCLVTFAGKPARRVNDDDRRRLREYWDRKFGPEYVGLLDGFVVDGPSPTDPPAEAGFRYDAFRPTE